MKKLLNTFLLLGTLLLATNANAQQKELTVGSKVNSDKSVTLTAEKNTPGTYTVVINYRELSNSSSSDDKSYKIKHSGENFLTLTPINKDQNIVLSYSYRFIRGELQPKYSGQFLYAIPYKNGKKVRVAESGFFNATYFGSSTPDDWKAYRFYTEEADTVTAIRKGIVVNISDLYDEDNKSVKYTSKVNTITVEHADGTLANYKGFKKGVFVKEGQLIFPGSALGINSITNERYGISLMLTYLKSVDFESAKTSKESKSLYGFITPYFCTVENPNGILTTQKHYTVSTSPALIQQEMTKKEIKSLAKN